MRSRFFGASSYDDDDDEEEMDLSGFVTSSETQPVVVERKRAPRTSPSQSDQMFGRSGATNASNMGNAGPKTNPPPPMSNVGYYSTAMLDGEPSEGTLRSHFNPLYTSDNMNPKLRTPVVLSKTFGAASALSGALVAGMTGYKAVGKSMMKVGTAMYVHPVIGVKHGVLGEYVGKPAPILTPTSALLIHGAVGLGFYQIIASGTPLPEFQGTKFKLLAAALVGGGIASAVKFWPYN